MAGCSASVAPAPSAPPMRPPQIEAPAEEAPIEDSPAPGARSSVPGWLGVALAGRSEGKPGVIVSSVLRGSPAAVHGLHVGDVVLGINDGRVNDPRVMSELIAGLGAGSRASFMLERAGEQRLLAVQLGENPGIEGQLRLGFLDAPAPELQGVEVAQGALGPTLQSLRGQVVVLEFWATWCGACRALLPTLNGWHERFAAGGGRVVSVTMDPAAKAARDAAVLGLRYPVLADPEGETTQAYQAFALPTLFVIDRAGVVRDVSVGYDPARIAELEATLQRLMSET